MEVVVDVGGADRLDLAEVVEVLEQVVTGQVAAAPEDAGIQAVRARVLQTAIDDESSLMGKAFLSVYLRQAQERAG